MRFEYPFLMRVPEEDITVSNFPGISNNPNITFKRTQYWNLMKGS